jgi:hypothetical protein
VRLARRGTDRAAATSDEDEDKEQKRRSDRGSSPRESGRLHASGEI